MRNAFEALNISSDHEDYQKFIDNKVEQKSRPTHKERRQFQKTRNQTRKDYIPIKRNATGIDDAQSKQGGKINYLKQQRLDLVQNIITKDTARYGYLSNELFATQISSNWQNFSNEFLAALYQNMLEFDDYHVEVMKYHSIYGSKYKEFQLLYQQCFDYLVVQQQQIYQQQLLAYQQQQKQIQQNSYKSYLCNQSQLENKNNENKIVTGKNYNQYVRLIKKEISDKPILNNNLYLNQRQFSKKEIINSLNLLAPENLKEIQKDLIIYLFFDQEICQILSEQIIQKAWARPKYASTYAKLCSEFSKVSVEKFEFQIEKQMKKDNPFKLYLISRVQDSFGKKVEDIPEFQNGEEKEAWLKDTKNKILGNVKFIAELILQKVLKKKIMKICISQLLFTFLTKYYYFRKTDKLGDSYYDYYFEALIEFIQNIGDFYERMDENGDKKRDKKQEKAQTQAYQPAEKRVIDLIEMNQKPPEEEIEEIGNLNAEDYFRIFTIIDERILRKKNTRLSALLLNLTERRSNNWKKQYVESGGLKKLKDIKEDIAKEQQLMKKIKQQKKTNLQCLNDLVKNMLKDWDKGKRNERTQIKSILKDYNMVEFLTSCLNQFADERKELLIKRLQLFDVILDNYFDLENLRAAFFECIKHMAFNSSDYPYAGALIALILKKILTRQGTKLRDFYYKAQEEDEEFFLNEVFGKLYYYTMNEQIKEIIKPSKKYSNMLKEEIQSELRREQKIINKKMEEKKQQLAQGDDIPGFLLCPISQEKMVQPILVTICGHTFEGFFIRDWVKKKPTCPLCGKLISDPQAMLIKNFALLEALQFYKK